MHYNSGAPYTYALALHICLMPPHMHIKSRHLFGLGFIRMAAQHTSVSIIKTYNLERLMWSIMLMLCMYAWGVHLFRSTFTLSGRVIVMHFVHDSLYYNYWGNIFSIFSSNSEANASELLENIEEMFHWHYMDRSSTTYWYVASHKSVTDTLNQLRIVSLRRTSIDLYLYLYIFLDGYMITAIDTRLILCLFWGGYTIATVMS